MKPTQLMFSHMYKSIEFKMPRSIQTVVKRSLLQAAITLAVVCVSPSSTFSNTIQFSSWDIASQFNDSTNPSGVFSYLTKASPFGFPVRLATQFRPFPDYVGWTTGTGFLFVAHNARPTPFSTANPNSVTLQPHALVMHPGENGGYAVVRFTAPTDGNYKISGQFYAVDNNGNGTITDVWIIKNNRVSLFSGQVNVFGGSPFASFTNCAVVHLRKGATLDFEVGFGADNSNNFDTTGLNGLIEQVE